MLFEKIPPAPLYERGNIIDDVVRNPYKRVEEEYFLSGIFWEKPSRNSVASPIFEDAEEVSEQSV